MTDALQKAAAEGYNVELTKLVAETFSEHADKLPPEFKRDLFLDLADTLPAEAVFEAVSSAILKAAAFCQMFLGVDEETAVDKATTVFIEELRVHAAASIAKDAEAAEEIEREAAEIAECHPEVCGGCAKGVL